jgi:microsomal dipeptidase-like Zn-dependent dipeptidase
MFRSCRVSIAGFPIGGASHRMTRMPPRIAILLALACATASCANRDDAARRKRDLVGSRPAAPAKAERAAGETPWREVHRAAFVVDLIEDFVFRKRRDGWTLLAPEAHTSLDRELRGGVDLVFAALPGGASPDPAKALEADLADMEALVAATDGKAAIVKSLAAARDARAKGVLPIMLLLEGADAVAASDPSGSLAGLEGRGVAAIGLVGERGNAFADSAAAPGDPGGLTARGAALVQACREQGLLVDLTHASPRAFWDALAGQNALVAVTHTAARALRDHPRNLDDLQILALARTGGVMGLVFNPDFIRPGDPGGAAVSDVVAHAAHVKELGALAALALGTDFGGIVPPRGLTDVSALPEFTESLGREGFTRQEIDAVLGGNAARALEAAEAGQGAAESSAATPVRPIGVECDFASGDFSGDLKTACDGYVLDGGAKLAASSVQRLRLKEMTFAPTALEIFGEPGTPWQIEGQALDGKVLFRRIVALGEGGRGEMSLPENRNLTRIFLSPTRASTLREAVVWGR